MATLQLSGNSGPWFGIGVPHVMRHVRTACLALGLVLSSTWSFADPLQIVSGAFGSGGDDTGLWAVGSNWDFATGALPLGMSPVVVCDPCVPGTTLNLSSTVTVGDWGPGSARLPDGRSFGTVYYSGSLNFNAGSVVVPDVPPQPEGLDYPSIVSAFTSFTFTGWVSGFADPSRAGPPLFTLRLVGSGSDPVGAWAGFANVGSGVFLDFVDYHFDEAAPVPEPGSMLLLGSGAAWVLARRRRRRPHGAAV